MQKADILILQQLSPARDKKRADIPATILFIDKSTFSTFYMYAWGRNFDITKELSERMKLKCNLDIAKPPVTLILLINTFLFFFIMQKADILILQQLSPARDKKRADVWYKAGKKSKLYLAGEYKIEQGIQWSKEQSEFL